MKNSVILTLAALMLCGCAKDDDGCNENDYYYPPRDYSHLGDMSRYDGYYWNEGKKPIVPIPNRYQVIFKSKCSRRILSEFEKHGITVDEGSCVDYELHLLPGFEIPDELKDCKWATITSESDPASVVKGLINSQHLYLIPPATKEYGASNIVYAYLEPESETESVENYAEVLGVLILEYDYFVKDYIAVTIACTNRSAGNHVQVANWLYETGEFLYAYPEMGGTELFGK